MKRLLAFGTAALALAACSPNQKVETSSASTKPLIQEVFTSSETLNGTTLKYPKGKPELRLYRVEIPAGGKIPLHTHPAPMMVYVAKAMKPMDAESRVHVEIIKASYDFEDWLRLLNIAWHGHTETP